MTQNTFFKQVQAFIRYYVSCKQYSFERLLDIVKVLFTLKNVFILNNSFTILADYFNYRNFVHTEHNLRHYELFSIFIAKYFGLIYLVNKLFLIVHPFNSNLFFQLFQGKLKFSCVCNQRIRRSQRILLNIRPLASHLYFNFKKQCSFVLGFNSELSLSLLSKIIFRLKKSILQSGVANFIYIFDYYFCLFLRISCLCSFFFKNYTQFSYYALKSIDYLSFQSLIMLYYLSGYHRKSNKYLGNILHNTIRRTDIQINLLYKFTVFNQFNQQNTNDPIFTISIYQYTKMTNILQKIIGKLVYVQVATLIIGKIMFGIVQMPYTKAQLDMSHIPYLIIMLVFYILNIAIKFYRNRRQLLSRILNIQLQCFLLWVITFLGVVFEWGLCDQMHWNIFQKITSSIGQLMQTFIFTLIMHPKLITKCQFIGYQALLATSVIGLGVKTVQFIAYNQQAIYKDIVVLNLTTEIALSILLMDVVERAYSKFKSAKPQDSESYPSISNNNQMQEKVPAQGNTSRLQAQMIVMQDK